MRERWRALPEYEGRYEVSELGRVRSLRGPHGSPGRILKRWADGRGYLRVTLFRPGSSRRPYVHRLVAAAFLGGPLVGSPRGLQVMHLNHNPSDCRLVNLAYGGPAENAAGSVRCGEVEAVGVESSGGGLSRAGAGCGRVATCGPSRGWDGRACVRVGCGSGAAGSSASSLGHTSSSPAHVWQV